MDDLIKRQVVMDTVAKSVLDLNDPDENWIMQDRIKEIPSAQPEPHWIPCSERLPDKPDVYLVSSEGISVTIAFFADGKWTTPTYLPLIGIDAWKPLEEPWRGEE